MAMNPSGLKCADPCFKGGEGRNRTNQSSITTLNGFEDRGGHQAPNTLLIWENGTLGRAVLSLKLYSQLGMGDCWDLLACFDADYQGFMDNR